VQCTGPILALSDLVRVFCAADASLGKGFGDQALDEGKVNQIMRKIHIVGVSLVAMFAFLAVGAASALAAGEWLADGKTIATPLASETSGELNLINLKSAGGAVLVEVKCSGIFEGTVGGGGNDSVTALIGLAGEKIGGLGDTNATTLNCTVTATAKELGDCVATGELAEVLPTNLSKELSTSWSTLIELMELGGVHYYLDKFPSTSGYEVKCKTSLGELENKCEGATSAFLTNSEPEGSVIGKFGKVLITATEEEESEATNCNLTGTGTGTLSGEGLTVLVNKEDLSVSQ
jgi:hypothetical protein